MSEEQNNTPIAKAFPGNNASTNRSAFAENRHFFGIKAKDGYTGHQDFSDDYEKRFPEDAMFDETGPNARVWRTYLVESTAFDETMVGEARDGLDAMLVFAGLFSAVVTSFLVQTSESLQPDYMELSASLLSELIAVQRAAANGTSVNAVPSTALNQDTNFAPDTLDIWVNGLWVVSLTLSLIVALSAVLIKQWLHRYIALRSGTPRDRSHIRHSRFIGFEKWQVLGIIGSLPVIMHLSLGLFFLGLVLFLIPLQLGLACIIGGIALTVYTLYIASNIVPIFCTHCPYQTPLSDFIIIILTRAFTFFGSEYQRIVVSDDTNGTLSVQALHWLFSVSTNPSVHSVVLQAVGGLPATAEQDARRLFAPANIHSILRPLMNHCIDWAHHGIQPELETVIERLMRGSSICNFSYGSPEPSELAAVRIWQEDSKDPRYLATALSRMHDIHRFDELDVAPLLRQIILSHHHVYHHQLVWKALVQNCMFVNGFDDYSRNPALFRILFPAVFGDIRDIRTSNGLKTMAQAVLLHSEMHQELCKHLLTRVSANHNGAKSHLSVPVSNVAEELLMTILELALHFLSEEPSQFDSVHWQIIGEVFSNMLYSMMRRHHMRMFFRKFTALLVQQTDICNSQPQGSQAFFQLQQKVLEAYRWSTWGGTPIMVVASRYLLSGHVDWKGWLLPVSTAHSIQDNRDSETIFFHAIGQLLAEIPLVDEHMHEYTDVLFSILASGLLDGFTSAYMLVVEYDCLELGLRYSDQKEGYNQCAVEVAMTFTIGLLLNTTVDVLTRERCVNYLFQRQNLHLAIISYILTMLDSPETPSELSIHASRINELVMLRPDQGVWNECQKWLHHISKWVVDGRKEEDIQSSQELGDRRILESMLKYQSTSICEMIERFIRPLEEFLAKGETTNKTAHSQPGTAIESWSGSSPAIPIPEVKEKKVKNAQLG